MVTLTYKALEPEVRASAFGAVVRTRSVLASVGRSVHAPASSESLRSALDAVAINSQANAIHKKQTLSGCIARMLDPSWWRRNIRANLLRENEKQERRAGVVRRKDQVYVSDHAVKVKRMRRRANRETLDRLEVVSDDGEAFNLLDVSDGSISNPAIRRAELMMRCRGFEEVAKVMGHKAIFLTVTCPSRFHRISEHGIPNKKWDGSTPKDAQKYLCDVWKKIRASWKRRGYMPYGFRVAEPHHEGCPHWHILLFVEAENVGWFIPERVLSKSGVAGVGVVGVAGVYALRENPQERGAMERRFTCKMIDPEQGSATGYIAKYICKNIDGVRQDGDAMGLDYDSGRDATEASERVRDWASLYGIRQFQQIGGPSVTVWRELRRVRDEIDQPMHQIPFDFVGPLRTEYQEKCRVPFFDFEGPRRAADESKWGQFWVLQGGPWTPKTKLSMAPFMTKEPGGKYGDEVPRVIGVEGRCVGGTLMLRTKTKEWKVQHAGTAATDAAYIDQLNWMGVNKGVRDFERAAGLPVRSDVRFPLGFNEVETPWTRVNNCTPPELRNRFTSAQYAEEISVATYLEDRETRELRWALKSARSG